jgi:hypothetical protein
MEYSSSGEKSNNEADIIMVGSIPCRLPHEHVQRGGHEDMEQRTGNNYMHLRSHLLSTSGWEIVGLATLLD